MEEKGSHSLPLKLPLSGKEDALGLPHEPGSSHRFSLASTGAATAAEAIRFPPLPPCQQPRKEVIRHGVLISPRTVDEAPRGTLMTPAIIHAKEHGKPLPPLREDHISMLGEFISPYTASMIDGIPKDDMLRMAGPSMHTHDVRFTEDVKQYHLDHPAPPDALRKYPNYENFPLLLSRIHRPTLEPNVKETKHFEHLRGHNEAMLENKWQQERMRQGVSVRETYMHVPNFGRVQAVLTDLPDGTSYPLVTLPKMTPYDILGVLEKQQKAKERSWMHAFMRCIHKASCGLF